MLLLFSSAVAGALTEKRMEGGGPEGAFESAGKCLVRRKI